MSRLCAECSSSKGVSSIVGMIFVLAILALVIPSILSSYLPIYAKKMEIERFEDVRNSFFTLTHIYPGSGKLVIPTGKQSFLGYLASFTAGVKASGNSTISALCEDGNINVECEIPSVFLYFAGRTVPNRTFIFSEGGLVVEQDGKRIVLSEPDINVSDLGELKITVDCLVGKQKEVSGSGTVVVSFATKLREIRHTNCTGTFEVKDSLFQKFWGFEVLSFSNKNVTFIVREVRVEI